MSWLKKIMNMLKENEIEEGIQEKGHRQKQNDNVNRNIETRVTYQYPKGTFRFPAIPDHVPIKKEKIVVKVEPKVSKPLVKKENKINVKVEKPKVKHPIEKKRIESKIKQPFKPTDIPSPVFGFNRPNRKNNEVLEFELSSHHSPSHIKEIADVDESPIQLEIEKTEVSFTEDILESSPVSIDDNEFNNVDLDEELEAAENDEIVSVVFDDRAFTEQKNLEDNKVEKFITNVEEAVSKDCSVEKTSNEQFEEIILPSDENNRDLPVLEEDEDNNEQLEQQNADRPVRSHIPFNVIMLKQDREKWQQCQQRRMKEPEVDLSTEINYSSKVMEAKEEEIDEVTSVPYAFPSFQLLYPPVKKDLDEQWVYEQSEILNETLKNFNVRANVVNVSQGPTVTRFEVQPEPGVKVNKITNLSDDIKLSLAARDIRIEAPIPGKHTVGIELPNPNSRPVMISEIINSTVFDDSKSPLTAALGLDISGKPVITDLRKMPHGLIAGATGSGKSVCINSILVSLLYKATPSELKLLLIDPKMVELAPYNHIPHLVSPVITDVKAATAALKWAVEEMERRYELFAHTGVRDIQRFNEIAESHRQFNDKLPYMVIIIDELADLMMMSPADVEEAICRIAQKARACGIHLIIATQRPSVDVITGLIKANVPTRIAFSVSSQIDSRTIIDIGGAEKLLGRGDMLFLENGSSKSVRLQGTFVSDEEIDRVVKHVRQEEKPNYLFKQDELLKKAQIQDEEDELFVDACEFVMEQGGASTSLLQRNFRVGYNRAARLIEMMEQQGIISEAKGSKPRDILVSRDELETIQETASTNM